MKIVFMGTPEFAARALAALLSAECSHTVVAVVSQPDRRAGRGKRMVSPPVAALAKAHGLPLLQPNSVKTRAFRGWVASHGPDIAVVAAFGHLLGPKALSVPTLGCINVHASLLPRWRGASPIQSAIAAGDAETGVSIMQMDVGMDTGDVFAQVSLPIRDDHTGASLHEDLAVAGAGALLLTLDALERGDAQATPQPAEGITHAAMISKSDGDVDWRLPAAVIGRRMRAFSPWPGTRLFLGESVIKAAPPTRVIEAGGPGAGAATVGPDGPVPGTILSLSGDGDGGVIVACGGGSALSLTRLQAPGRKMMAAADFLRGFELSEGMAFDICPSEVP